MGTGGSKDTTGGGGSTKNQYIDFAPGTPTYNIVPRATDKIVQIPTMFRWPYGGRKVYIVGTFNQWKEKIPMTYNSEENSFVVILNVTPGKHLYRFIVDNEYKTDPNNPTCKDNQGYLHNMIQISESTSQLSNQQEEDYENEQDSDEEFDEESDEEYLIDDENDTRKHKHGIDIKKKESQNKMDESPLQPPTFKLPEPVKSPQHTFAIPQPVTVPRHISPQTSPILGALNTTIQPRSSGSSPSVSPVSMHEHQQNFLQQQMMMHQQQFQQQQEQQQKVLEAQKRVQEAKQKEIEEKQRAAVKQTEHDKIKQLQAEFFNNSTSPGLSPNTPSSPNQHMLPPVDPKQGDTSPRGTTEPYGYTEQQFAENKKSPPTLPPHLRYTPLNSSKMYAHDPALLPVPLHVTVNHTYFSERETMNVIGITQRYREKFSTAVLYKPKRPKTNQNAPETQQ